MRKPIIAGNWKMFKTRDEALQFVLAVNEKMPSVEKVDSVICAPFIVLRDLVKRQGDNLRIGAQNMHFEEKGAFTGEIAPVMLTSTGVTYVIIGHSERRAMFNETDETCNLKLVAAFEHGLKPILCVGESLEQRESGKTEELLSYQLENDLKGLSEDLVKGLVIAYEPIWAIGTGKTATAAFQRLSLLSQHNLQGLQDALWCVPDHKSLQLPCDIVLWGSYSQHSRR